MYTCPRDISICKREQGKEKRKKEVKEQREELKKKVHMATGFCRVPLFSSLFFSRSSLPFRPIVNTRQGESGGVSQKRAEKVRTKNGFDV